VNYAPERTPTVSDLSLSTVSGDPSFVFSVQLVGPAQEDLEWLRPLWILCGQKKQFEVRSKDLTFPGGYKALLEKLKDANKRGVLDYWPAFEGASDSYVIRLAPGTVAALEETVKPAPRTPCRQITVQSREIDLRNRANFDLVVARIEDVEDVAESYLTQLRSKPTKKQRRACTCQLQRILLLRGAELSRWLYGSISLRIGSPLPSDFWTAPYPGNVCG